MEGMRDEGYGRQDKKQPTSIEAGCFYGGATMPEGPVGVLFYAISF